MFLAFCSSVSNKLGTTQSNRTKAETIFKHFCSTVYLQHRVKGYHIPVQNMKTNGGSTHITQYFTIFFVSDLITIIEAINLMVLCHYCGRHVTLTSLAGAAVCQQVSIHVVLYSTQHNHVSDYVVTRFG